MSTTQAPLSNSQSSSIDVNHPIVNSSPITVSTNASHSIPHTSSLATCPTICLVIKFVCVSVF